MTEKNMNAYRACPAVKGCPLWVEDHNVTGDRNDWGCLQKCCATNSIGGYTCIVKMALDETGKNLPLWESLIAECSDIVMQNNLWDFSVHVLVDGTPVNANGNEGKPMSVRVPQQGTPARLSGRVACECDRRRD